MGQHLIHSQTLDLRYSNASQAKSDMDRWGEWYRQILLPTIGEVLDEVEIPGKTIRIDSLDIDLGYFSGRPDPDSLRRKLRETLKSQIFRQAPELIRANSPGFSPIQKAATGSIDEPKELELLAYLLENGRKPWWATHSQKVGVRQLVATLSSGEASVAFRQWLESRPLSLPGTERLANHLGAKKLENLAAWVFPKQLTFWKLFASSIEKTLTPEIFQKTELESLLSRVLAEVFFLQKLSTSSDLGAWLRKVIFEFPTTQLESEEIITPLIELIFFKNHLVINEPQALRLLEKWVASEFVKTRSTHFFAGDEKKKAKLQHRLQKEIGGKLKGKNLSKAVAKKERSKSHKSPSQLAVDETFPISNAGLVLTAPFLPYFFQGLGLVENRAFVSPEAQQRAALLIQALLDEHHEYEESDLLLNKILCGIPTEEVIPVVFSPTDLEKEEIPNLLDVMTQRWAALKSTSGKSMALGFFPREGSLRRTDKGYQLHIPRVSIDILLNRLPWAISIIKLPWMDETLFVEW